MQRQAHSLVDGVETVILTYLDVSSPTLGDTNAQSQTGGELKGTSLPQRQPRIGLSPK